MPELTLYQFKALSETEQLRLTFDKGVFLADRQIGTVKIALYQVGGFYVEVFYNQANNTIDHTRSFITTELLEPYLEGMVVEI